VTMFKYFVLNLVLLLASVSVALAQGPAVPAGSPAAPGTPAQPGMGQMLIPFVAMFAVMYFLMIRPQQKKAKEQAAMMNQLKAGDEVLTTSGILGTVSGVTEKVVTLEVAPNVKIKMLKGQVAQIVKGQL
jgi:preprotein translocase subunit YajC